MAVIVLTFIGSTPGQTQFGLDTITERYKCQNDDGTQVTADAVLASDDPSVPGMTQVHPIYEFMFVTGRHCDETGDKAAILDIEYMGCIRGEGGPALPSGQQTYGHPVQTATTFASNGTTNVTVQFYAIVSAYSWITYVDPGTTGTAPAPTGTPEVISFTVGNASFSGGESELLSLFQLVETDVVDSIEIVAGNYWQNRDTRTLYYSAILTVCKSFSTRAVCISAAGSGYSVSDTLTCTDLSMNTAVMVVTAIGGGGSVTDFTISSDDIPASIFLVITASGGGGSGASFRFYGA